ncbi:Protein ArsC [uncultured archaeon]|nr:Protein ArsC [uncultured archaeon]
MAEAFFNHYAQGATASSAGSRPDGKIDEKTVEVMREKGLELGGKKPAGYAPHMGKQFDYVVTMGCREQCPITPAGRTIAWEVEDPKGKALEDYRRVRDEVEGKVRALAGELGVLKDGRI